MKPQISIEGFKGEWISQAIYNLEDICEFLIHNGHPRMSSMPHGDQYKECNEQLLKELVYVAFNVKIDDQRTAMQMASVALILVAYLLGNHVTGYRLTHHHIIDVQKRIIDANAVDYNHISYLVRNNEDFLSHKSFKPYIRSEENRHYQISSGNFPLSATIYLQKDDEKIVDHVIDLNTLLFGHSVALRKILSDFSKFPAGSVPRSEAKIFEDNDLAIALLGKRVMLAVYGINRDFKQYPEVVQFECPGQLDRAGPKKISAWLAEAYSHLKNKYLKSKGQPFDNPWLTEQAIQQAEKVVEYLVQQGGIWATPLIQDSDFDLKFAIAKRIPQEEACRLLLDEMFSETRGVKRYCAAVLRQLDIDLVKSCLKTDKERVQVYNYTHLHAIVDDIVDPKYKRQCLESDLEI